MKMRLLLTVCLLALTFGSVHADTINVLWYTGGTENSGPGTYEANLGQLSAQSLVAGASSPSTPDNVLNITFWQGGSIPIAPPGGFNTLVVASPQGGWSAYPDYTALEAAFGSSALTLGNRIMATGQDADWHYQNGPGPANFDGPQGFLIDAIDWSGSGTGMGAVFLGGADIGEGGTGMLPFLPGSLGASGGGSNEVDIPAAFASFPINSGLSSAGLSNWNSSAHSSWNSADSSVWTVINVDNSSGLDITLVTNGAAGGLTPSAPEPASMTLAGMGLVALLGYARRRKQGVEVS